MGGAESRLYREDVISVNRLEATVNNVDYQGHGESQPQDTPVRYWIRYTNGDTGWLWHSDTWNVISRGEVGTNAINFEKGQKGCRDWIEPTWVALEALNVEELKEKVTTALLSSGETKEDIESKISAALTEDNFKKELAKLIEPCTEDNIEEKKKEYNDQLWTQTKTVGLGAMSAAATAAATLGTAAVVPAAAVGAGAVVAANRMAPDKMKQLQDTVSTTFPGATGKVDTLKGPFTTHLGLGGGKKRTYKKKRNYKKKITYKKKSTKRRNYKKTKKNKISKIRK
jgi:hypothetical protein